MSLLRHSLAAMLVVAYALMCVGIARRWRRQQRAQTQSIQALHTPDAPMLIAHASQTGTAEQLALQTAQGLQAQGQAVRLLPLNAVTPDVLAQVETAWFIVSTHGEGDAPDAASVFADRVMGAGKPPDLQHLKIGVLALGDRQYAHFCAFGHRLNDWLAERGAEAVFETIEVDNGHPDALACWQSSLRLSQLALPDAPFCDWELVARKHINPGSQGNPLFWITLRPVAGHADWQAGDLLQLQPNPPELSCSDTQTCHIAPDRPREYSIASLPERGTAQLLVRLASWTSDSGEQATGLASGQLANAPLGSRWAARIKANPSFRIADNAERPLILIGNGSGLAGLHAHLLARRQMRNTRPADAWLVHGERSRAHDAYFMNEWREWQANGQPVKLSLTYSRDGDALRYVQHALRHEADALKAWVNRGAAIYVCGSRQGMAAEVDATLREVLGGETVDRLIQQNRIRRDVY